MPDCRQLSIKKLVKYGMFLLLIFYLFAAIYHSFYNRFLQDTAIPGYLSVNLKYNKDLYLSDMSLDTTIDIADIKLPTNLTGNYAFQLPSYITLPFTAAFGTSTFIHNLIPIILSFCFLIMIFYFFKGILGFYAAAAIFTLLSVSPGFIYYASVSHVSTEPFISFFFLAAIMTFIYYQKKKQLYLLFLSAFLFGTGFSIKLSYIARISSLAITVCVFYGAEVRNFLKSTKKRLLAASLACFLAGAGLFVVYNLKTDFKSFKYDQYRSRETAAQELSYTDKLGIRYMQLENFIMNLSYARSGVFENSMRYIFTDYNRLKLSVQKLSFLIAIVLLPLLKKKYPVYVRNSSAITLFYLSMFFQSPLSPASLSEYQMSFIFPFFQFISVIAFMNILKVISHRKDLYYAGSIKLLTGFILLFLPFFYNLTDSISALVLRNTYSDCYSLKYSKEIYSLISKTGETTLYISHNNPSKEVLQFLAKGNLKVIKINNNDNLKPDFIKEKLFLIQCLSRHDIQMQKLLKLLALQNGLKLYNKGNVMDNTGVKIYSLIKIDN